MKKVEAGRRGFIMSTCKFRRNWDYSWNLVHRLTLEAHRNLKKLGRLPVGSRGRSISTLLTEATECSLDRVCDFGGFLRLLPTTFTFIFLQASRWPLKRLNQPPDSDSK